MSLHATIADASPRFLGLSDAAARRGLSVTTLERRIAAGDVASRGASS